MLANHLSGPKRTVVDLIDRNVSPELARLIEHRFWHGAEIEDVIAVLNGGLKQIERAKNYCGAREREEV